MIKEYAIFISIISKPKAKKTIYLRLTNPKKEDKIKEENLKA